MPSRLLLLLCLSASPLLAQTMTSIAGTGETVLIPGAPFQAERVTHLSRSLSNGTQILKEAHENLARDSQGRFYDASQTTKSGGQSSTSPAISYELADPVVGKMSNWSATTAKGNERPISSRSRVVISTLPLSRDIQVRNLKGDDIKVVKEDLGSKTIAGLLSSGTRTTTTIPLDRIGNTAPLVFVTERWVSIELKMTISETETDPINGIRTSEFTTATRVEPPPSLFMRPEGIEFRSFPLGGLASPPAALLSPQHVDIPQ